MINVLYEKLGYGSVSVIIISVAIMLFCGFLTTRLTKLLKLPNVTAYIITGIIIGPFVLDLIPETVSSGMNFISDIALAFIAFSVGEYFRVDVLKKNLGKLVVITLFESLAASVFVFVLTYFILGLNVSFSLVLAALASATAPASTMMTIRQTKASGDFVETLLSVVAFDDVISLLAFSIAISVASASLGSGFSFADFILPLAYNVLMIGIGVILAFALKFLMKKRSTDNRLIVSVALLFLLCGIGAVLGVSPLLGCMAMGMVYINISGDDKLFKQLNYFSPPILLLFFVHSGVNFRINMLFSGGSFGAVPLIVIGVLYFIVRIAGKYAGAFTGCAIAKKPKKTRNCLGLALIPQAGVAIGLAALAARTIGGEEGAVIQTIILSSSILYELIGPACAKLSLYLSGAINATVMLSEPITEKQNKVDELKERVMAIQKEIDAESYANTEEEKAFNESAFTEDSYSDYYKRYGKHINRR
ncbi:MAG: cation:proton antiporter [Clostridia bacterium]|nr:cation:proton antiporter [Clostridia bacterium]